MFDAIRERLDRARTSDGGYGSVAGAPPEPESTAMAALALRDAGAVSWLVGAQSADGSFGTRVGTVFSDDTALVSLALPSGTELERALDHVEATSGVNQLGDQGPPPYGWPWTDGAYGWTEPTAWGILALRARRPSAETRIEEGLDTLRARECPGGGWNYGTPVSFDVDEPPFAQTTAIALLAIRGADPRLSARGLRALTARWRSESSGVLTLATATAALRALGSREEASASAALARALDAGHAVDTVALAWSAIAVGPGLMDLVVG